MMEAKPFVGTVETFKQAYPSVKTLRLLARQRGEVARKWQEVQTFTEHNLPPVIPCANPRCYQGGSDLSALLMTMTCGNETEYKMTLDCNGHEGTPKGRKRGDPCQNSIDIELSVSYQPKPLTSE